MVRKANKPCGAVGEVILSSPLRAKGEQSLWSCQPWSSGLVDPMGLQEHEPFRTTHSYLFSRCPPLPSAWVECWFCMVQVFAVLIGGVCSSLLPGRLTGGCFHFFGGLRGGSPDAGVEGGCPCLRMLPLPQRTCATGGKKSRQFSSKHRIAVV